MKFIHVVVNENSNNEHLPSIGGDTKERNSFRVLGFFFLTRGYRLPQFSKSSNFHRALYCITGAKAIRALLLSTEKLLLVRCQIVAHNYL